MDSGRDTLAGGFPHSEISGSMLVCQLPGAFRRLPRLSSPVVAKASTACAWSLDPPTRSTLGVGVGPVPQPRRRARAPDRSIRARSMHRTFHIVKEPENPEKNHRKKPLRTTPPVPRVRPVVDRYGTRGRGGGARRVRTADPRLAKPALSRLSYGPTAGGSGWTRTTDLTLIRGAL